MTENPYVTPNSHSTNGVTPSESDGVAPSGAVSIREAHIKHEATIRAAGLLYYIGSVLVLGAAVVFFIIPTSERFHVSGYEDVFIILVGLCLLLGIVSLFAGRGLRNLRGWARVPVGIVSGIGLLIVPLGTLINGYILFLVFSKKGSTVFSSEYQDVVRKTRNIKAGIPILFWVALALLFSMPLLRILSLTFR